MSGTQNEKDDPKRAIILNLDDLGKVRSSASSVIRQVRTAHAAKLSHGQGAGGAGGYDALFLRQGGQQSLAPLVRSYLEEPLFEVDEADPLFSSTDNDNANEERNTRAATGVGKESIPSTSMASKVVDKGDCDLEDNSSDSPTLKRKRQTTSSLVQYDVDDDDNSDDDFVLSTLKKRKKKTPNFFSKPSSTATAASRSNNEDTTSNPLTLHDDDVGESDSVLPSLHVEDDGNHALLDHELDCSISTHDDEYQGNIDAMEAEYMEALDDQITEAEFRELSYITWSRIKADVVKYRGPGGLVENDMYPMEPMTREQSCLARDWDFRHAVRSCDASLSEEVTLPVKPKRVGPFDVDYMGNGELLVTKELPKYVGCTQGLLLTQEDMSKFSRRLARAGPIDEIRITVKDKADDPETVVVEIQGGAEGVSRAKQHLELMVRMKQMRFLSLQSIPRTRPPAKTTTSGSRKVELYMKFVNKYEKVRLIDFGGIRAKSVNSSMWQRHKDRFGSACTPACECPLELGYLTSTVIDDMLKKGRSDERPPEIGFSKRFAPKFMPLLRKEFPRETNEGLLTRLIRMWESHLKQQRFGTSCRETCPCLEGWGPVFHKGGGDDPVGKSLPSVSDTGIPVATKRKSLKPSAPYDNNGRMAYEILFDTKSPLGFFCATRKENIGNSVCYIVSVSPSVKDARLSPGTVILAVAMGKTGSIWHQVGSHDDLKKYYDTFKRHLEGHSMRIRFINTEVKADNKRSPSNHWTFNSAWRGNPKLNGWAGGAPEKLVVVGNDTTTAVVSSIVDNKAPDSSVSTTTGVSNLIVSHADADSQFQGGNVSGYLDPEVSREASSGISGYEMSRETSMANGGPSDQISRGTSRPEAGATSNDALHSRGDAPDHVYSSRQPGHRVLPKPLSILNTKSSKCEEKKPRAQESLFRTFAKAPKRNAPVRISWAEDFGRVVFNVEANAGDVLKRGVPTSSVINEPEEKKMPTPLPPGIRPNNTELLSAIADKSCSDVFKVLQDGANPRPINARSTDVPETFAKKLRDHWQGKMNHNPTPEVDKKLADFKLKVGLIKIIDRAQDVMTSSSCLTKWAKYEARIRRIENLHLTSSTPVSQGDKLYCTIKVEGKPMEMRVERAWAESIDFPGSTGIRYKFSYNDSLADRFRHGHDKTFAMTLSKTIGKSQRTIVLASQAKPLDDIKSELMHKEAITITIDMPRTEHLESGRAIVTVRKLRDERRERVEKERGRLMDLLKQVISDVKRFNSDRLREATGMSQLDFNLRLPEAPHITLLHAAVYLNNRNLVSDLIASGADINVRNDKGVSPRALALTIGETYAKEGREEELGNSRAILELLGVTEESVSSVDCTQSNEEDLDMVDAGQSTSVEIRDQDAMTIDDDLEKGSLVRRIETLEKTAFETKSTGQEFHSAFSKSTPPRDRQLAMPVDALPGLTAEQLLPGKKTCRFYSQRRWCRHGQRCYFLHFERIKPEDVSLADRRPSYHRANLSVVNDIDQNKEACFTALFHDTDENVWLTAVGGDSLGANRGGVYWYRTREDAVSAIERVIAHWQKAGLQKTQAQYSYYQPQPVMKQAHQR